MRTQLGDSLKTRIRSLVGPARTQPLRGCIHGGRAGIKNSSVAIPEAASRLIRPAVQGLLEIKDTHHP